MSEWIKWNGEELPRGNYIVQTNNNQVMEMRYEWNQHAKTRRGQALRWVRQGRVSPWEITHYQPLPEPTKD